MSVEAAQWMAARTAPGRPAAREGMTAIEVEGGSFAQAMAAVDIGQTWPLTSLSRVQAAPSASSSSSSSSRGESALDLLARQLDEVGRRRVQAQTLSAELASAWATGLDTPTLAVSMHRQARAMASYNLSVMWGAKLVGVTAGALKQLVAAA